MQTTIAQAESFGPLGSPFGDFALPRNAHNNATEVAGVYNIAFTFASAQTHTITINGFATVIAGNTDDATTATDALAAMQAVAGYSGVVTFAAGASGSITATEDTPGAIVSISGAASGGAATTVTTTTATVNNDDLDPGVMVFKNINNNGLFLPRAAAASPLIVAGVVMHRHEGVDRRLTTEYVYPTGSQVPFIYRGGIIVRTEETVTEASSVFYRITATASNPYLGAFRTDNDSGRAVQLTGARFLRGVTGAGRAPLAINLP